MDVAPRLGSTNRPEPAGPAANSRFLKKISTWAVAVLLAVAVSAIWFFLRHPREQEKNRAEPAITAEKPEAATGSAIVSTPTVGSSAAVPAATSPNEVVSTASPSPTVSQSTTSTALEGYNPGIAFVDMNRIFKEYTKTKSAEKKINESKQVAKKDYDDRADAYKKALDEINNLNRQLESGSLSASAKNAKRKERDDKIAAIKQMEKEINDFRVTREKELQDEAKVMREGLVNEMTARINSEARQFEGIVFDKSRMSLNSLPVMMFTSDDMDMSAKVISALNDNQPSPFKASHDLSFAVVDMNRIFKAYNKTREAEGKINLDKEAAKKEYDERADSYKKALDEINELNKKLQSSSGSGATRDAMVRERDNKISDVRKMEKEINKFRETREKQLKERTTQLREGIVREITDMIGAKLDRTAVAVVIDISGNSLNGAPLAASVRGVPDYSNETIAALNEARDKESGRFRQPLLSSERMRVGLVDLDRAFKSWPGTKEAEAEIDASKAAAKKEYGHESKDVRDKKEKELQDRAKSLRDGIVAKIMAAVRADATREGFNLVFDSSGKSLNGVPVVVLASGIPDLTDKILEK
jgi:Skp family chaperone for outer membrane proteins